VVRQVTGDRSLRRRNPAREHGGDRQLGGVVAFVGDDPTSKSSTVPNASEGALAEVGMPVLYPGDVQDLLDLGQHAVACSRATGLWTAVKVIVNVADGAGAAV
jgi:indolepyruvate ferredoxin oxidoreductase